MKKPSSLSDAETRRESIIESALSVFAKSGYASTPVADVAAGAGISPAYVFKLYPTKEGLFVAALERCFQRIEERLAASAELAAGPAPDEVLGAMADGYARLIANRDFLMIQVHAQSASDIVAVRDTMRRGLARLVRFVKQRSGADDAAVQRFMAFGQLCHLIVTTGLIELDDDWARILSVGIRHYD